MYTLNTLLPLSLIAFEIRTLRVRIPLRHSVCPGQADPGAGSKPCDIGSGDPILQRPSCRGSCHLTQYDSCITGNFRILNIKFVGLPEVLPHPLLSPPRPDRHKAEVEVEGISAAPGGPYSAAYVNNYAWLNI